MKKLCAIIIFLGISQLVFSQQLEYKFINYNTKNGLTSNSVNAILKDKNGFMWFATENGLSKFNGQKFTEYHHKDNDNTSIGRGPVITMRQDKTGRIWLATNLTLSVYNLNLDAFINYDFSKYGWITSLCIDNSGKVWVGTYSGLFIFNPSTQEVVTFKADSANISALNSNTIKCIFEDSHNDIWIGTDNGLHFYDKGNNQFIRFINDPNRANTISNNQITCINEDKNGQLWIGTIKGGINVMNSMTKSFSNFKSDEKNLNTLSDNHIHKIAFDKNGQIWVGTESNLDFLNPTTGVVNRVKSTLVEQNGFTLNSYGRSVRDIFIDDAGIYWVAFFQTGINKYDTNLSFFNHKPFELFNPNGLTGSSVMSFAESSSGEIYIGTEGTGLNVFNRKTGQIKPYRLPQKRANTASIIALESVGNALLVGTYQAGLYNVNLKTGASQYFYIPANNLDARDVVINCFKKDRNGKVWIGTNGRGICRYDPLSNQLQTSEQIFKLSSNQSIPLNNYITTIEQDQFGNIWFGSNGTGIAIYNVTQNSFRILNSSNSGLPIDVVQTIFCDHSGNTWVGSLAGGLCLYKPTTNSFECYNQDYSLSNDVIYKILEDEKGKLWVSTNKGICSFDFNKKVFRNFTHYNGVQQSTFNIGSGLITSDKTLFFGGLDGFNYFKSTDIFQKYTVPVIVTTSLKINNKQVNAGEKSEISEHISIAKEMVLSYKQNFSIDFIALNYTAPHENRYSYKLEGFDKEWNEVGTNTTAVYTNLDPKTYIFRLKAHGEDGSWETPEKVIKVIVKPPFWRTYYAYVCYTLLIILIILAIRRGSIQKLKNEFKIKQERLEMNHLIEKERHEAEQKMELEKVKIKFLTNLSHELKTPLTLVLNPIENLMFEENNTERLEMLNLISRNAKRLLNLVNQLLDFRRIEDNELTLHKTQGDLIIFTQEIFDSFKYMALRKNISLHFWSSFSIYETLFDKDKIERVLINLLSNAIKFTNYGGNIKLQITKDGDSGIKITLTDTGIGLPNNLTDKIFNRFFKVDNNADILNQGSGIGLSIAQEFIKLHGGTIKVESEESVGSSFTISLPLVSTSLHQVTSSNDDNTNLDNIENQTRNGSSKIEKPIILIVDDDDDLRAYLVQSLKTKYKVIEACDGRQGWQKALTYHPQLIISDVNMPVTDGIDMARKIKNDTRTKHIPIIMLTVMSEETHELQGLEAGASDYLTKPFSFHLLSIKIENLLNLNNVLKNTYSKKIQIETPEVAVVSEDEKFLLKIIHYVEENIENPNLTIEELSKAMFVSRGTLYAKVLNLTGETPNEYVRSLKLKKALSLLQKNDMKISQIAYSVGFSNPNYFARAFKTKYNVSPSEYLTIHKNS